MSKPTYLSEPNAASAAIGAPVSPLIQWFNKPAPLFTPPPIAFLDVAKLAGFAVSSLNAVSICLDSSLMDSKANALFALAIISIGDSSVCAYPIVILVPLGDVLVPEVLIIAVLAGVAVPMVSSASTIGLKSTAPKSKKKASFVPTGKILVSQNCLIGVTTLPEGKTNTCSDMILMDCAGPVTPASEASLPFTLVIISLSLASNDLIPCFE